MSRTATRAEILALVPHAGAMCLWDAVLDWSDDGVLLETHGHRDPAHPLRHDGRLHAVHLCEYGAQAMAVHGGLRARASGGTAPPGMLVALRGIEIAPARIDDLPDALRCEATLVAEDAGGCQYGFRILHRGDCIASGRATVMPFS
ncbi:phosphotransferase [Cognatiluteimonas lumbrici]|uniref:phosphotransferase n=1 Tax=Cognatiluteimonas lumbrici TaxID=2559601 RepID=UPI00112D2B23|nr:phosphotransferase [Luteimonas lumbrici]